MTPQIKARVTVRESIVYESGDASTPTRDCGEPYAYLVDSKEEVYQRRITVGPEWTKLDLGWIEGPISLIHISNEEGKHWQRKPTPDERAEVERRVVEVGIQLAEGDTKARAFAKIRPGRSTYIDPIHFGLVGRETIPERYMLRCLSQTAKCQLTIIPA